MQLRRVGLLVSVSAVSALTALGCATSTDREDAPVPRPENDKGDVSARNYAGYTGGNFGGEQCCETRCSVEQAWSCDGDGNCSWKDTWKCSTYCWESAASWCSNS
jgi:hypothetical protein